ncbi:glycosyltransferase family 1 protein [Flavimarina sp. Hel_I_48]|uniref:glycosyltransferase family 1 protein n=1 Tax=Flavimarina sp. Hel_I_48 TaxID=1392488 RepID=UPI0006897DE4|nr:glycosyltransferase family 1 protein [Flavimarina sp. Hel_I_48]
MSSTKKILVLAETINEESSSAGKANNAFIKALKKSGFSVKTYHFSHLLVTISEVETILISEKKIDLYYFLSRMQRVLQRFTGKNWSKPLENRFGFSFTFKNDVNSMVSALRKENPEDYGMVITLSKGASYRAHAAILKLHDWHKKWLAYLHDPYPFHWYPSPYDWVEAGHKQKELFFIEIAQKARWLGYPSLLLADWMGQFHDNFKEKAVILPHQVSERKNDTEKLPRYFKPENFTVLHAGNLLKQRDPFPLIEAWQLFLRQHPEAEGNAQLLFLGPATFHEPGLTEVCGNIPSIYKSDGYVDYATVSALEKNSSANIIMEAVSNISPFLPAKFPGLVKANRKIFHLGPKNSESRQLLGVNYPFIAEADDVEEIAEILGKLFIFWNEDPQNLKLGREDLEGYFSFESLGKKVKDLLIDTKS